MLTALLTPGAQAEPTDPTTPEYQVADAQSMADAYGRITGENGQLRNPAYLPALVQANGQRSVDQLLDQMATPTRPAVSPGFLVPGWNVGNPLRAGWAGTRGRVRKVTFTNKYGALLRGKVWAPLKHARDPYTGRRLHGPYPGVVITTGSVQGSQGMYEWLAQDLAERGYVVLTYDVQGQGTSETLPHESGQVFPFCDPTSDPAPGEMTGCPGVPFQQLSNFVVGTRNALGFFTSTPRRHYPNAGAAGADVNDFNPFWRLFDRSKDRRTDTPGRTTRIAIIGHSLGAQAVSKVQQIDQRAMTVVAMDKLATGDLTGSTPGVQNTPTIPALALQSEYGFTVTPWWLSGGSSLQPQPSPAGPDPMRERATGFDGWHRAGIDSMLVVPHASTHLDYTDIPLVLPASRYGQDLDSTYIQLWLDRYLKHRHNTRALLASSFTYLEPQGDGVWKPITLKRDDLLSKRYCSAYSLADDGRPRVDLDIDHVGC
ncbi:alpha/beta hydrolase [Nocardioides sp. CBS4Y-1]|uniref:Alpha/beta hydrolase n=1 Tax=Nocardioides acrostichi TaxID=2784339 RepID=A0A930Y4H5_9ACTN|nr:alpha/beta hydrolase [Nocardioides acrostichi]